MGRRLLPILGLLLLAAAPARADRAIFALEQDVTYQSNLFKTPEDEESDAYYRLRPSIRLLGDESTFSYDLFYRPSFDFYFDNGDLDDDSHYARGSIGWVPVRHGELRLSGEVSHYRSIRSDDTDTDGAIPEVVPGGRGSITRAIADLAYEQRLRPDWTFASRAGLQSYSFTDSGSADSLGFDGEASLLHELRSNLALGGSLFVGHRSFDEQERSGTPRSRNIVANGSLVLRAEPIRSWTVEILGGPALVAVWRDGQGGRTVNRFRGSGSGLGTMAAVYDPTRCRQKNGEFLLSSCPIEPAPAAAGQLDQRVFVDFDPGRRPQPEEDIEVTGFARVELRKTDRWGFASLAYSRWEEGSAGISSTAIRDSVTGTLQLEPGVWIVRLRGNWNQREDATRTERSAVRAGPSSVPSSTPFFVAEATGLVPDAVTGTARITQYWFDVRVSRPLLLEQLTLEMGGRYLNQRRHGVGDTVDFDNYIGTVGLRYEFWPLHYLE